ncbi:MAG: hypothetical protein B6245_15005 [Desulfobacteraceae bacterium 4572_88]|nr:MAG: hypothetical protein B6245_15005 [Desulfobacteraceae bacterium 4572_88]
MIDLSMLPDFIAEASEHLEEMESDLLRLEGDLGNRDILNDIFRAAHTIKGSAEYLGMEKIAELSHKLENLLEMLRLGERTANREIFDTLIESIDRMALLTEDLEQFEAEKTDTADIIERIDRLSENPSEQDAAPESEQELAMTDAPQTYLGTCAPPRDDNLAASDHDTAPDHPVFPDIIDENRLSEDSEDEDISDETKEDAAEEDLFLGDISEDDGFPSDADEAKEDARAEGGFLADLPEDENLLADVLNDAEEMTFEDDAVAEDKAASETEADSHITLTADDIYDDEYDDELFDIFIQHLKENISFIKNQTEHLSDSKDKGEELGKCLGYLNSLQSSANYMDYRNLTGFYEKWISEIESIREHLFLGKEIAFASPDGLKNDVAAGMMAYVNEIARHFPQVTDSDSEPKGDLADDAEEAAELPPQIQDAPEADAEGSVVSEVSDTFAPENLKSQDESPDMETEDDLFSDDMGEFEAADTDILPRAEAEDTDEGGRPSSSDYQGLFGELDDAFDALADDLDSEPEPESEAASEDLEEKLAASATEGPASSPETEKRPGRQAGASDWEAIPEAIQEASEPSENLVALETSDEPQSQGKIERPVSHEHIALETEQASEIYGSYEAGNRADTDKIATKAPGPTEPEHLPEKFVKKQTDEGEDAAHCPVVQPISPSGEGSHP